MCENSRFLLSRSHIILANAASKQGYVAGDKKKQIINKHSRNTGVVTQ